MNNDLTPHQPSSAEPVTPNAMNDTDFEQFDSTQLNAKHADSNCGACADDLLAYHHRELPLLRRALVGRHLSRCPHCREELHAMNTISATLKKTEAGSTDESPSLADNKLNPELRAKILSELPERVGVTPLPDDAMSARSVASHRTPWAAWGATAVTICIVAAVLFPTFSRSRQNARYPSPNALSSSEPIESPAHNLETSPAPPASPSTSTPSASAGASANALPSSSSVAPLPHGDASGDFSSAERRAAGTPGIRGQLGGAATDDLVLTPYRRVHKQGSLTVEVSGLEAAGNSVETMIQKAGGFVAKNDLSTGEGGLQSASLEIRVPVKQFDAVIKEISALGKVQDKRIAGEDITARVSDANEENNVLAADLRARLAQYQKAKENAARNKRAVANDWMYRNDIRQMRIQLAQVRARIDLLKKMSDFASLSVQLREKSPAPNSGGFMEDVSNTGKAAFNSLLVAARLPIALFIYILVFSPFWVPILIAWRYFLRSKPQHTGRI